jgi:nucleotide-binding universal stress UspA family protein
LAPAAKLLLLHVIPDTLPAELRRRAEVKAHDDLKKAAASATQTASVAGHSDLVVEIEVSVGKPFAEIIRRARQMGTELTVVGRHGQRHVRDLFIGSTAMRVIRKGDVPVLAVSRKPMHSYRRPLLALALEDASFRVVEITAQIIGPDLKVVPVVHACHVPFVGWMRPTLTQAEISSIGRSFGSRHPLSSPS